MINFKKTILTASILAITAAPLLLGVSCNKHSRSLSVETDSLSYVIGMNVGYNLLQMDSTLNIEAVCAAIRDIYTGETAMDMDEARVYFLRQMNYTIYEKFKLYEERFLSDLAKSDRSFVRTKSGVTYKIPEIGDQQALATNSRDTVVIRYRLSRQDGSVVESSFDRADTTRIALSDLVKGLQETIKLVGSGGSLNAWIPSELAYGTAGNEALEIAPNSTLYYEIDVLDVIPYRRR